MKRIQREKAMPPVVESLVEELALKAHGDARTLFFPAEEPQGKEFHAARAVLFDFWSAERFRPGHSLAPCTERKQLVTRLGPLLNHFEQTFRVVIFDWIERLSTATKQLQKMENPFAKATSFNVDVLVLEAAGNSEVAYVEASGGTETRKSADWIHAIEDGRAFRGSHEHRVRDEDVCPPCHWYVFDVDPWQLRDASLTATSAVAVAVGSGTDLDKRLSKRLRKWTQ
ncbi:hypothetical protein HDU86_004633 [Geranomyces michiganensis]|nr:hypothetical protein HDU86_004633 [Geranomyces michiganensis]